MGFIYLITLILTAVSAPAGDTWATSIEQNEEQMYGLQDVTMLSDGSVVISLVGPFSDPFLVCFGREGNVRWYRQILEKGGTSRAFESGGYLLTVDEGFASCFHSEPRATGIDTDVAVIRCSNSGDILWTYVLGEDDESNWMCTDMILCSDGGFLITGCPGTMLPGGFALKLSQDGNPEWMTAPNEITGYIVSAIETDGGDFLLLVEEFLDNITIQSIDPDGAVSLPLVISDNGNSLDGKIKTVNGSIWIITPDEVNSFSAYNLDDSYELVRHVEHALPADSEIRCIDIHDECFVTSGNVADNTFLAMIDFDGNTVWQRIYNTGSLQYTNGMSCYDDGFLLLESLLDGRGYCDAFCVIKTDSQGMVEGAEEVGPGMYEIEPGWIPLELDAPGWVMACTVLETEEEAESVSIELMESTGLQSKYLWIPDYQSLSGAEGWMVYAFPFMAESESLEEGVESLSRMFPEAYFIFVSQGWDRQTMSIDEFFRR